MVPVLGGALLGMSLRIALPERHLGTESRELVRLTMGLLATISALVVGLLITTAKTAYDEQPFEGLVRISTTPLREALLQLGR
jgi:hypothetical protein